MDQVEVAVQLIQGHVGATGVQVAKGREGRGAELTSADKRQTLAATNVRTVQVAQQLVIAQRALEDAVAHVVRVQAHPGTAAAVEARALIEVASGLVLTAGAVEHVVAAHVERQAVVGRVVRAAEMSLGAGARLLHRLQRVSSCSVKPHHDWRGDSL